MKTSKKALLLILLIAVNYGARLGAEALHLPFWLDTVGTLAAAMYLGLVPGIIAAAVSSVIFGLGSPLYMLYGLVTIPVAAAASMMQKNHAFEKIDSSVLNAFLLSILSVGISFPLNMLIGKGYSGNIWGDTLVDMLLWNGAPLFLASLAGEIIVDFFDKQVTIVIILLVRKLCRHISKVSGDNGDPGNDTLAKGPERKSDKHDPSDKEKPASKEAKVLITIAAFGSMISMLSGPMAQAADAANYTVYNRTNGLLSLEANCLTETPDGTIWIGSYAGLLSYDGSSFQFIKNGGIANVNALFADSDGRLFIGTNDNGIAVYDDGKYTFYTEKDGLPSDSVRCFAEDDDGNIFAGTSEGMFEIKNDGSIRVVSNSLSYVNSMCYTGGRFICTDNSGDLYLVSGDGDDVRKLDDGRLSKNDFFEGVFFCGGKVLAAASAGKIYEVSADESKADEYLSVDSIGEIKHLFEDHKGRLWAGGTSGFGYFSGGGGNFKKVSDKDFIASISCIFEDYQKNIWLCSNDQGIFKISDSQFLNFSKGIFSSVTNATVKYKDRIYSGTDQGLYIQDEDGGEVKNDLTKALKDVRIRCLMKDSAENLWISTYSDMGLIESDGEKIIKSFDHSNSWTTSDRVRLTYEMKDGTIACGTADGLCFIKNGTVSDTITDKDGLLNTQILSLTEADDGTCLAGTDGAGIFMVRDGKIISHIGKEEGLNSNIILRMVPYRGGFFVVTSNSISYLEDGKAHVIKNFPYFNNFDILIKDGQAYVLSSAGIYSLDPADMKSDKKNMKYKLYGTKEGIDQAITANSFSFFDGNGLYFCTSSGVLKMDTAFVPSSNVRFGLGRVSADGKEVSTDKKGRYIIPADTKVINILPSVRNFTQTGLYVRMNVCGRTHNEEGVLYDECDGITINDPKKGNYKVRVELMTSPNGKVIANTTFMMEKEPHPWENPVFYFYVVFMTLAIMVYTIWVLVRIFYQSRRKRELEEMRYQLESELNEKTEEIRKKEKETEKLLVETVEALTNTIDAKDTYTSGHSRRVARYSRMLAERLGLPEDECELIYRAGLLHDVGKIRVPKEVINKPGRLTDEEFELMKIHPVAGFRIISGISWDKRICYAARFHHERFDGSGYPDKRAGEEIPFLARIIGVADAYDAMSSNRSYRDHMPQEKVREQIEKGKGKQFDPMVADAMLKLIDEDKDYKLCQTDMGRRRVLITDDDKMSMMLAKKMLSEVGEVEIIYAESHEKEIKILKNEDFDLLLQDIWLPDGYGLDIMKEVHKIHPDLPVIIMSGDKELTLFEDAINSGAADFISKPFVSNVLKEMVRGILYD